MHALHLTPRFPRATSLLATIATASFFAYMLFVFFGTGTPFQEAPTDPREFASSNILNQVVITTLFFLSSLCLLRKRHDLALLAKKEKFLTIFLFWCLLSIFWSDYSFLSFKRVVQIIASVCVIMAGLFYTSSSINLMRYLKIILYLYVPLNLISVLLIPGAMDPDGSGWRGIGPHKNLLGQTMLVSLVVWFHLTRNGLFREKIFSWAMLLASAVMVLGARSATSLVSLIFLITTGLVFSIDKIFRPLRIGRAFSAIVISSLMAMLIAVYFVAPELIISGPALVGRDTTFTGRTELWEEIFQETRKHPFLGTGYAGFWIPDSPTMTNIYRYLGWLPRDAHNGYLDILNETGVIGLSLIILMVLSYYRNLFRFPTLHFGNSLVLLALLVNLQESTLFRPHMLTGVMFLFGYLALYVDLIKANNAGSHSLPVSRPHLSE